MNGNDVIGIGYKGKEVGLALKFVRQFCQLSENLIDDSEAERIALNVLKEIYENPESLEYRSDIYPDETLGTLANYLIEARKPAPVIEIRETPLHYEVFNQGVEVAQNAIEQMDMAMRMPVAAAGALMPDAHLGYGLPIGGVWGLKHAVSPNAVGSDIACQVNATVLDVDFDEVSREDLTNILFENTQFNHHAFNKDFSDKAIFRMSEWDDIPFLAANPQLKEYAIKQFGSAGDGNHFANFGVVNDFGPMDGKLALVTHWGSRNLGAHIAKHYHDLAVKHRQGLPKEAQNLAWLNTDTEEGYQYVGAMQLAELYASEGHTYVHDRIRLALREKVGYIPSVAKQVRSVHNIATWEDGLWVHRKGATPAMEGQRGVIPGSMVHPTYLVEGLGNEASLNSASHGAGRRFSRGEAKRTLSMEAMQHLLVSNDVTLIGAALDESPEAYKNIEQVMDAQQGQVYVTAAIMPKIVRMAR